MVLPGEQEVEEIRVDYDCGTFEMSVDYVNAGPVSLAVFEIDGQPVVASNVISASGARYAGDAFIWWVEGKSASLFDLTAGEDAPPRAECKEIPG
nr:MliC family protein [Nitratireductor luteus]